MKTVKRLILDFLVLAAGTLSVLSTTTSCQFDDSKIWDSIENIEDRLKKLEEIAASMQSDIDALKDIVNKMQEEVTIDSVIENEDGSITLNFSDGTSSTISDGEDGVTPPSIIVLESEGQYWWAYKYPDGKTEFLTDEDGNKIPVSGTAPQVRINPDNNHWEISTDGGKTWTDTGVDASGNGESIFDSISQDDDFVYITIEEGTVITIPKSKELSFSFGTEGDLFFAYSETKQLSYTMSGASKTTITKPDGWKVKFVEDKLEITAPAKENTYAEAEGVISIILIGANGQSYIAEQNVAVGEEKVDIRLQIQWTQGDKFFTDLHFGPASETGAEDLNPSNCFLVRPGKTYRFRTNVMGRGADGVAAMNLTEETNELGGFTINKDASIHSALSGDYEYIYFTTTNEGTAAEGGNGVISVVINEKVAWTWHIWARAEDPELETMGSYQQMAVNLGSWGPEYIKKKVLHDYINCPFCYFYGLPYSWGFNVPYPGLTSIDMAVFMRNGSDLYWVYQYDENNMPIEVSERAGMPSKGLKAAVENPLVLADLSADGEDIYANMWHGINDDKTIFDPCPYGYRVADNGLYNEYEFGMPQFGGLQYSTDDGKYNRINTGGILEMDQEKGIPTITNEKMEGYYWSCEPSENKGSMYFFTGNSNKGIQPYDRVNGALIRCIRYDKEQ